jgi:hypothetical protein
MKQAHAGKARITSWRTVLWLFGGHTNKVCHALKKINETNSSVRARVKVGAAAMHQTCMKQNITASGERC